MDAVRTVQLRRYRIVPGELPAFTAWWRETLLPAREAFGFRLEFAVAVPETDEFVWAVSADGDADAFATIDAAWAGSSERAACFVDVPQRVTASDLRLAEPA
ncbi:hypothetical protein [Amnibacterium endophyticum]|uniref:NIPSNAP domain-containing protein n=1 Tax=Amnibacterium endophyticum TaxID=2109337 RepID=A0ABW4LJQ9_9MICO